MNPGARMNPGERMNPGARLNLGARMNPNNNGGIVIMSINFN